MAAFFVSRPVFAWVLAIVTMLAGGWAITNLAVSQYPDIAPTTVYISASYSGATAEAVENSVTRVIEDGLTGLDGLLYMESSSSKGSPAFRWSSTRASIRWMRRTTCRPRSVRSRDVCRIRFSREV
jgi:multidrug efflux pump subunit AcrB